MLMQQKMATMVSSTSSPIDAPRSLLAPWKARASWRLPGTEVNRGHERTGVNLAPGQHKRESRGSESWHTKAEDDARNGCEDQREHPFRRRSQLSVSAPIGSLLELVDQRRLALHQPRNFVAQTASLLPPGVLGHFVRSLDRVCAGLACYELGVHGVVPLLARELLMKLPETFELRLVMRGHLLG